MQRRLGIGAALAGAASTTPVVDGRAAPHPDDGLEWKVCAATGRIDLFAIFPGSGGAERVDVSMLLGLPNLVGPLARAFRAYASGLRQASRRLVARRLRIFAAYVRSSGVVEADLDALATDVFFAEFVAWLDAPRPAKVSNARTGRQAGDVAPLCLKERIAMLGLVRSLAEALLEDPDHGLGARRLLAAIPRNQWPGAARKFTPKQRIAQDDWSNIVAAAEREAVQVMTGWAEGMRLLEVGRARLLAAPGSPDYADLATCMARLDQLYPGVIPAADRIEQDDRRLRRFVQYVHRQKPISERLYPSPRSLVPWVILFAAETALNASAVMGLNRSDVRRGDVLGRPVIWITGEKRRAARDPLLPFDASEPDGARKKVTLATIVDFLISYTERLRGEAAPEQRDRLFLVAMRQGSMPLHPVRAFHGPDHAVADSSWFWALSAFRRDNGLARFALDQVRPTVLDEEHRRSGDLALAQRLGGHRSAATTWRHYTSDGTRQRLRERLGGVFVLRERWWGSGGRIDPRALFRAGDEGAATPYFRCLDPFDSPRPGQRAGRLCTAYGECPSCPLAAANIDDPVSVAHYNALAPAILEARDAMPPSAWLARWAQVLADLEALLAQVDPPTLGRAAAYHVHLPPV